MQLPRLGASGIVREPREELKGSDGQAGDACARSGAHGTPHLDAYDLTHHDPFVRTTLTLDDDVATKLRQLAHRRRRPFKEVVNEVLRHGLSGRGGGAARTRRFRVHTFRSAFRPGVDPHRLNQLADEVQVREFAERPR